MILGDKMLDDVRCEMADAYRDMFALAGDGNDPDSAPIRLLLRRMRVCVLAESMLMRVMGDRSESLASRLVPPPGIDLTGAN